MRLNTLRLLKLTVWLGVIVLVLFSGEEGAEARKRNNHKIRKGGKRLKKHDKSGQRKRHHQRRSNMKDNKLEESVRIQQSMLQAWQDERSRPKRPGVNYHPQIRVEEWREAVICAHSKHNNSTVLHKATARVGHHSASDNVVGKLVHILDPNMNTHYGCAGGIGNIKDIPRDEPWIAMLERGKCLFFNKIRLAKLHNASAVVVYNHKDEVEVMNTAGTSIMAVMVSKSDGRKISQLLQSETELEVKITIHNETRSNLPDAATTTSTSTIESTSGSSSIRPSYIPLLLSLAVTYAAILTLHRK